MIETKQRKKRKGNLKSGKAETLLFLEKRPDEVFHVRKDLGYSCSQGDRFITFFLKKEKGRGNYSFCKEKILARGYDNVTDMILAEGCIPNQLLWHHIYYQNRTNYDTVLGELVRKIKSYTMMKFPETLI